MGRIQHKPAEGPPPCYAGISTFAFIKITEGYTKNNQQKNIAPKMANPANLQSYTPNDVYGLVK